MVIFGAGGIGIVVVAFLFFMGGWQSLFGGSERWENFQPDRRTINTVRNNNIKLLDSISRLIDSFSKESAAKDSLMAISHPSNHQSPDHQALQPTQSPNHQAPQPTDRRAPQPPDRQAPQPTERQAMEQLQAENNALKQQLEDEQKQNSAAAEQLATLRHTNEVLMGRLAEADTHGTDTHGTETHGADTHEAKTHETELQETEARLNTLNAKNVNLERRSAELADQLLFAEVDCNLSRADARQIVYNDRQRKDLLTDALTTLTSLCKSPDEAIQKKAKEKLALLKNIAAAVHD